MNEDKTKLFSMSEDEFTTRLAQAYIASKHYINEMIKKIDELIDLTEKTVDPYSKNLGVSKEFVRFVNFTGFILQVLQRIGEKYGGEFVTRVINEVFKILLVYQNDKVMEVVGDLDERFKEKLEEIDDEAYRS